MTVLAGVFEQTLLTQFIRYGFSGGAAAVTHIAVLVALVELAGSPPTAASVIGFVCATAVNYALQHRFVFGRNRGHVTYLPRYLGVTAATMTLNTLMFWGLVNGLSVNYVLSQVLTIGFIVPINFAINRGFTFAR